MESTQSKINNELAKLANLRDMLYKINNDEESFNSNDFAKQLSELETVRFNLVELLFKTR